MDGRTLDRAAGVLVASAAGDALGVPYEFRQLTNDPQMLGGGLGDLAPGQWSDDTDMACAITRAALKHPDLRTTEALDAIAAGFLECLPGHRVGLALEGLVRPVAVAEHPRRRHLVDHPPTATTRAGRGHEVDPDGAGKASCITGLASSCLERVRPGRSWGPGRGA